MAFGAATGVMPLNLGTCGFGKFWGVFSGVLGGSGEGLVFFFGGFKGFWEVLGVLGGSGEGLGGFFLGF